MNSGSVASPSLLDRLAREIGARDRLRLALHRLGIDRRRGVETRGLVGLGEVALLILEQHLGDAGIVRACEQHERGRRQQRRESGPDHPAPTPPDSGGETRQVDRLIALRLLLRPAAVHPLRSFTRSRALHVEFGST